MKNDKNKYLFPHLLGRRWGRGLVLSNAEGFSLIEMVIVIGVISILSGMTLVALIPSRNKAKDERIISDLNQARLAAEKLYNLESGSPYKYVDITKGELKKIADEIKAQNSVLKIQPQAPVDAYALYAALSNGKTYCVDSAGRALALANAPSASECK